MAQADRPVASVRLFDLTSAAPRPADLPAEPLGQSPAESHAEAAAKTAADALADPGIRSPRTEPSPDALSRPPAETRDPHAAFDDAVARAEPTSPPAVPTTVVAASDRRETPPGPAASDGDDLYLPRSALDQVPAAIAAIDLPYPEEAPLGAYRAVLTLFIDATGQVRRVRSETGVLPSSLEDAARQAFLAARFTPGAKGGQPVRSRIRVEVAYTAEIWSRQSAAAEPAR